MKYCIESLQVSGKQTISIASGGTFGPIQFGQSAEQVQKALEKYSLKGKFMKTKSAKNPALDYGGFHVFFIDGKCVAVELFDDTPFIPAIASFPLLPCSLKDLTTKLLKMGSASWNFIIGDGGFISRERSVGISINGDKVESVLVGCKGYYDRD